MSQRPQFRRRFGSSGLQFLNASARPAGKDAAGWLSYGCLPGYSVLLYHGFRTLRKVFRLEHLTNFGLALPPWPVLQFEREREAREHAVSVQR